MFRGSNPDEGRRIISSPTLPVTFYDPPSHMFGEYRGYLPGVWRPGREDHSPLSSEVKSECRCTSVPLICLYGMGRCNYILASS